jgi:hypothetical protein
MAMIYLDKLYGKIKITDPIIIDLIKIPFIQRLKGIDQAGYFEPYFPNTKRTRFNHSLGVYLLLKRYGASLEEQVSGLIHDVSHSVFSHAIDYILKGDTKEQNHQDNTFKNFIIKTEIPKILEKYKIRLDYILDDNNFNLKEQQLPDLCADRIDYVLRDAVAVGEIKNADYFLDNLVVEKNKWVFKDIKSAKKFAELFLRMNRIHYSSLVAVVMLRTVGDYFKYALKKKYLSVKDLYTTDEIVLKKVAKHLKKDSHLRLLFERMNNKIKYKNDPNNYDQRVFCKSRMIDPLFWHKDKIRRLSEIKPSWDKVIKEEVKPKEYFLKFER